MCFSPVGSAGHWYIVAIMATPISVLLVEDDVRLARFTAEYLAKHEVHVTVLGDGEAAIRETSRNRFDVIVLDLMLPKQDGLSVCQTLRATSDVPIIITTARVEEADRVLGLELGADDYVIKPFSPRELLARLRAIVRRDRGELAPKSRIILVGALALNPVNRTATIGDIALVLTGAEFDLLSALAQHPGRVLTREQLLRLARGSDSDAFDRAIDVQISRLRQKLAVHPQGATMIQTIRGTGYMLSNRDPR
jgi:DNA-binding response OmpR family regulator